MSIVHEDTARDDFYRSRKESLSSMPPLANITAMRSVLEALGANSSNDINASGASPASRMVQDLPKAISLDDKHSASGSALSSSALRLITFPVFAFLGLVVLGLLIVMGVCLAYWIRQRRSGGSRQVDYQPMWLTSPKDFDEVALDGHDMRWTDV